jgi:hypothetical protein
LLPVGGDADERLGALITRSARLIRHGWPYQKARNLIQRGMTELRERQRADPGRRAGRPGPVAQLTRRNAAA